MQGRPAPAHLPTLSVVGVVVLLIVGDVVGVVVIIEVVTVDADDIGELPASTSSSDSTARGHAQTHESPGASQAAGALRARTGMSGDGGNRTRVRMSKGRSSPGAA